MMTARFVSGIFLFALLIVDICCLPVKTGYYPDASDGSSYTNAAPNTYSYHGAPSGQFPPGAVRHSNAPNGIFTPSDPQGRGPAPSVSTTDWAVAPPSFFSGSEGMSTGTGDVVYSQPEDLSPPEPMYQAGGLSHYEKSFEHGSSERETEEQGMQPPPPPFYEEEYAGQGFTSQPQPYFNMGGWGPYPYYDFMFLTGQYPPGTITHTSSSYEHGRDHWEDVHYVRDYAPYDNDPAADWFAGDFEDLESLEDPMADSGQGGVQAGSGEAGSGQGDMQAGSGQGGAGQGGAQASSGQGGAQGGAQASSGQGGAQGGTQAGSGQGGAGQSGTQAGSGQSGAGSGQGGAGQAGSGQSGTQAGSGQSGTQAGSGQGGAGQSGTQAGSGQSGAGTEQVGAGHDGSAQAGSGQVSAGHASSGQVGAGSGQVGAGQDGAQVGSGQDGAGQDGAQAGSGQVSLPVYSHEVFWHPVFRQPGGYHLGKVTY